jgi:hypothetical protein
MYGITSAAMHLLYKVVAAGALASNTPRGFTHPAAAPVGWWPCVCLCWVCFCAHGAPVRLAAWPEHVSVSTGGPLHTTVLQRYISDSH